MRLKNLLASLFFVCAMSTSGMAQDIHFTAWDMSPLTINPAFTGAYLGSFRVGGIYRDQWRSLGNSGATPGLFTTPSAYIDAPIIRGFRKNDWVGVGFMLFSDRAGTFRLGTTSSNLSAAYHLGLNKKSTSVLTIGFQGGNTALDINPGGDVIAPEEQFAAEFMAMDTREGFKDNYFDYKGGIMLKSLLNKKTNLAIGAAFAHVTTPSFKLLETTGSIDTNQPLLIQFHTQVGIGINEKLSFTPQLLYQRQATAQEFSIQTYLGYKVNDDYTLRPGLGYRTTGNDAIEILLGLDIRDNIRAVAAYDFNISPLRNQTNGVGAFELGLYYIGKIYKKPDVKPAILCPRL